MNARQGAEEATPEVCRRREEFDRNQAALAAARVRAKPFLEAIERLNSRRWLFDLETQDQKDRIGAELEVGSSWPGDFGLHRYSIYIYPDKYIVRKMYSKGDQQPCEGEFKDLEGMLGAIAWIGGYYYPGIADEITKRINGKGGRWAWRKNIKDHESPGINPAIPVSILLLAVIIALYFLIHLIH
jgi:hypothetical protein